MESAFRLGRLAVPAPKDSLLPVDMVKTRGGLGDTFEEYATSGEMTQSGLRVVSIDDLLRTKGGYNPLRTPEQVAADAYDIELLRSLLTGRS